MHVARDLCWMVVGCLLFGACFAAILNGANEPEVRVSWETKQCVSVASDSNQYDCSRLPPTYTRVWVR